MLTPKEPWRHVFDRNQKKYNTQLVVGTTLFGVTLFVAGVTFEMNPTPSFIHSIKYSTVLPQIENSEDSSESETIEESRLDPDENVLEEEDKIALSSSESSEPEPEPASEPEPALASEPVEASEPAEEVQNVGSGEKGFENLLQYLSHSPSLKMLEQPVKVSKPDLVPLPEEVQYLLVGAGTASFAAFRAIKSRDPTAKILIIGDEDRLPYMRPPLSKELWFVNDEESKKELKFKQWNGKVRSLYYEPGAFYTPVSELEEAKNGGISVVTGRKVTRIDAKNQIAHLEDGAQIKYGKCLLATGGKPKNLSVLSDVPEDVMEKVTLFRKVEDFHNLDNVLKNSKSVTVFGGGFLGSELACALGQRAKLGLLEVNQAFQEAGNMAKVLPDYLSEWTTEKVKSEGVNIIPNSRIKGVKKTADGRLSVDLSGKSIDTDHVVVAVGVEPDHSLASASKLPVDSKHGGFTVNEQFEAQPNLWVAGDAAAFLDPQLGRRRVEHHDHAVVSGRLAGENMTGANKAYTHQSMFWSDLGPEVGYEAIGIVDSKLPTVGVFAKATETDTPKAVVTKSDEADRSVSEEKAVGKVPSDSSSASVDGGEDYGKGVIFYLQENKIVGVLLWNVFNRMNIARKVLKEGKTYDDLTEVAKLFNIHAKE